MQLDEKHGCKHFVSCPAAEVQAIDLAALDRKLGKERPRKLKRLRARTRSSG
jgi:hypothetical protein